MAGISHDDLVPKMGGALEARGEVNSAQGISPGFGQIVARTASLPDLKEFATLAVFGEEHILLTAACQ